jgi:hypothetical protein
VSGVALLLAFPITLNSLLNIVGLVLALALALIVLRFVLKAARLILTLGCLGVLVVAIFLVVVRFLGRG